MFKKYMHIEKFGNEEVEGIEFGTVHIQPKIDGSNGVIWIEDGKVQAGSRNRQLTLDNDNQGFYKYILENEKYYNYLIDHPTHIVYGEWLKKHTITTYCDDAWNKFYIFDILIHEDEKVKYIPYEDYKEELEKYNLEYIPIVARITNPDPEKFSNQLETNTYLIKEGQGVSEGIVIKNYNFVNKYGRITWAKIVRNEFKDRNHRVMGPDNILGKNQIEESIVFNFLDANIVEKVYANIIATNECKWKSQFILQLLNTVYHDFVVEETWNFIKKHKNPVIDFKRLKSFCDMRIKQIKPELF